MALTKIGRLLDKGVIKDQTNLGAEAANTDEYLLYDADADTLKAIQSQNVVGSGLITNKTEITTGNVAGDDVLLIFDTSAGTLKKITKTAFDALQPTFSSVSPSNLLTGDGTGNFTIVVAGTDFDSAATFKLVTDGGTDIAMDSVSRDSSVQLTGTVAKSKANLTNANEPFDVTITNGNGLSVTSANAVNIDAQPAWVTAAGSLSTIANAARSSISITVTATDPESGAIDYALTTGALPGGLSLNTSTGVISGDADAVGSNTTYNFTIEARDTASNATERDFSIVVQAPVYQSFTSSGTFSVPSGVSAVDVLVVAGGGSGGGDAGGGGGAGGLVYRPGFTVTPGGTVTVTVGDGGGNTPGGSQGQPGADSVFGTLTAKGGGGGGGATGPGANGGSGGGARSGQTSGQGCATQPTQPGESGNYGFGNPGGNSNASPGGGGGGGAGSQGAQNGSPANGGDGGVGKAYTIADGTTSVFYAGGGGGGMETGGRPAAPRIGQGGQGGGGSGGARNTTPTIPDAQESPHATAGTANRGGGGGGSGENDLGDMSGGKGIVIVSY
jgi:hypothetical protein